MSQVYDLVVVGGGVAGTAAVLAASACGLSTYWVRQEMSPHAQSCHWHGYLHRGHLYSDSRESALIRDLRSSQAYWTARSLRPLIQDVRSFVVGSAENLRGGIGEPAGSGPASAFDMSRFVGPGSVAIPSDERVLDGPAYLSAAGAAAAARASGTVATCTGVRVPAGESGPVEVDFTAGAVLGTVEARRALIAPGLDWHGISPSGWIRRRMSRMLVVRGDLPWSSFIAPGREAGGVFVVPRDVGAQHDRVWLVSDDFSSPIPSTDSGRLLDAWWACSVGAKLARLLRPGVLAGAAVGSYRAPKSSLCTPYDAVSPYGHRTCASGLVSVLVPSKWTLAPMAAVRAVGSLFPTRARSAESAGVDVAGMVGDHIGVGPPPTEAWEVTPTPLSFDRLLERDVHTLRIVREAITTDPSPRSVA